MSALVFWIVIMYGLARRYQYFEESAVSTFSFGNGDYVSVTVTPPFITKLKMTLEPTQPPIWWVVGTISPWVKWRALETEHMHMDHPLLIVLNLVKFYVNSLSGSL